MIGLWYFINQIIFRGQKMSDQTNRVVPTVWTQIINKISYNITPLSDTIGIVGPANGGALNEVLTFTNPTNALLALGSCRMTNQMFAAWGGGAGTIKVVRIGGTENFDSVLYYDHETSPDVPVTYDMTTYMSQRNATSDIDAFYDTVVAEFTPGTSDLFGEIDTVDGDVIFVRSDDLFDTLDIRFGTAPPAGAKIEVAYYNGDVLNTFNGHTAYALLKPFVANDVEILGGEVTVGGLTTIHLEWDLTNVSDWEQTSITDSTGLDHSGYIVAIRCSEAGSVPAYWDITRIARRIGAEAPFVAFYPGTFDPTTGYLNGVTNLLPQCFMLEGLTAGEDTITVQTRLVGPKVYLTIEKTDSLGVVTTEIYILSPAIVSSPSDHYVYDTEDLVTEINATSTIVTAIDLSGTYQMFGWATPTTAITSTFAGGSNNLTGLTLKDYARGLGYLARESDVYWLLPCIPEEAITTSSVIDNSKFLAILQLFYTHVNNLSTGLNQKPRVLMSWLSPGYQNVGTISNSNLNVKTGSARRLGASSRVLYVVQKLGFAELEGSGSLAYRRDYLAAYTVGRLAGLNPAVPATHKTLEIGAVDMAYDLDEMDVLIRNGVFAYTDVNGIGVCVGKSITTILNNILAAVSARRIADKIAVDTTALLEGRYIGKALETGVTSDIKRDIAAFLDSKIAPAEIGGLINGYANVIAYPDSVNKNKVHLSYDLAIKTDLDFIDQNIYLTNNLTVNL
jgi:hypothetical protein